MNTPSKSKSLAKKKLDVIREDMSAAHGEHESNLLRRALFKTNDTEVSQDLVQVTFLKTLLYLQKGGKIDLMRSFLNHVLGDLIIDEYRKNKNVSLDKMLDNGFEPGCNEYQRTTDVMDGEQAAQLLPRLPKKYEQ